MRARLLDEAVHGDQLITDKDGCSDATLKGDYAFAVTNLTTQNLSSASRGSTARATSPRLITRAFHDSPLDRFSNESNGYLRG